MPEVKFRLRTDSPIGRISPRLYGHFAEHLGRCCYDGFWVGRDSTIPNLDGFRRDVIEALRAMPTPLLRWPGGCYADHYHWRDGIGPAGQRQVRLGMSCGLRVRDDNSHGTHEFMRLCEMLGAEPYLAGNVGSGSVQELCDWMEYCNSAVSTTLAQARAANGSPEPFGVKLWGVGNENWGCGGNFDAVTYAHEYKRYATMLRHVDPDAELVACGFESAWNQRLLAALEHRLDLIDHLSVHRYWVNGGPEIDFDSAQYYALLAEAEATGKLIQDTAQIIRDANPGKLHIHIALDEWGVWHPEERDWGPRTATPRTPTTYEQAGTLRDALAAGIAFEVFHRHCNVLSMANLAQIVNVLHAPVQTQGNAMWLTPTYYAFQMHTPHMGATAVGVEMLENNSLPDGSGAVSATASRSASSTQTTLINRHLERPAQVRILCADAPEHARAALLAADRPNSTNSAEFPERVKPAALHVERNGDAWRVELPPHSLATVVWN